MMRLTILSAALLAASLAYADDAKPAEAAPAAKPAEAAKLSAAEILKRMEALNNGFADQRMDIRISVIDGDGNKKSYDMTMLQKGDSKRLVTFNSGDWKGMATLVDGRQVNVYIPALRKVQRVAAHNMNQSVVGSDLSSEDMADVSWAPRWNVALEKEDETSYWLKLTPKAESSYAFVTHRVDKNTFAQTETHYFNDKGEEVKRFINSDFTDFHGVKRNRLITVSDPRTSRRTEMELKEFVVNQGLKDDLFTVRNLQWGK